MIVADSSVLIAHLRGQQDATAFLEEEQERGSVMAPALVAWELWRDARTPDQRDGVEALLEGLWIDPFSAAMAHLAGELDRTLRDRGDTKPTYDLFIASHALFHDAPLATVDRDYKGIDGLQVVEPRGS